jgi:hypothetical protein
MFARSVFTRMPKQFIAAKRFASSTGVHSPKSTAGIWLGDSGAYPVMGVIVFALTMCLSYGVRVMVVDNDARLSKSSRKTFYRGNELSWDK